MNYVKQRQLETVLREWNWDDYAYFLIGDDMEYDILMPETFQITVKQLEILKNFNLKRMFIDPMGDNTLLALHFMFNA